MRGDVTEAAVLAGFVRHGLPVAIPFGHDDPYDLIVETPSGRLLRVQCKTAREIGDDVVEFNSCSTDHGSGSRDYRDRADVFGVFCPSLGRLFVVPVAETTRSKTRLRLRPARNNQRRRVRMADDFALERWAAAHDEGTGPVPVAA